MTRDQLRGEVRALVGELAEAPDDDAAELRLESFTLVVLAEDLEARFGIRVVTIAPGVFATPMVAGFSPEVQDALGKSVPFPARLGQPAEIASMVRYLASDEAAFISGSLFTIDGGWTAA